MKPHKLFFIICIIVIALIPVLTFGQQASQKNTIGIKAGLDLTELYYPDNSIPYDWETVFSGGFVYKSKPIYPHLKIICEALYSQKRYTYTGRRSAFSNYFISAQKEIETNHYLSVPVGLRYEITAEPVPQKKYAIYGIFAESGFENLVLLKEKLKGEGGTRPQYLSYFNDKNYILGYFVGGGIIVNLFNKESAVHFRYSRTITNVQYNKHIPLTQDVVKEYFQTVELAVSFFLW